MNHPSSRPSSLATIISNQKKAMAAAKSTANIVPISHPSVSSLQRYVGKSAFRVVDNTLVSASLRTTETISISCTREPFDCFLSTFKVRTLLDHFKGRYPQDAPSFFSAFLCSFDESIEGTRNLVTIIDHNVVDKRSIDDDNDEGDNDDEAKSIQQQDQRLINTTETRNCIKIRVTVVWSPKVPRDMFSNAVSFDCTLVKVDPQAVSSFSWTLVNDLHASVLQLAKIANKALCRKEAALPEGIKKEEEDDGRRAKTTNRSASRSPIPMMMSEESK